MIKNEMKNLMKNLTKYFTPSFNVLYIPEKSENGNGVIQTYQVIGNPKTAKLRSVEGNEYFTLPVRNREENFRSFRLDRVIQSRLAILPDYKFLFATLVFLIGLWLTMALVIEPALR